MYVTPDRIHRRGVWDRMRICNVGDYRANMCSQETGVCGGLVCFVGRKERTEVAVAWTYSPSTKTLYAIDPKEGEWFHATCETDCRKKGRLSPAYELPDP